MDKPPKKIPAFPMESLVDFYLRNYKKVTVLVTAALLGVIIVLGWVSMRQIKEVVVEDFNNQQLTLARSAASQIVNSLAVLRRELTLLSFSPAVQYWESVQMGRRIGIVLSSIGNEGCLEIRHVAGDAKKTYVVKSAEKRSVHPTEEDIQYLEWAAWKENRGKIQISDVIPRLYGNKKVLIMTMALPVWQVSVDEAHPTATEKFSGVLIFVIDATDLVDNATADLKSGKTGYAWVIDNKGIFLYHPVHDFIGKNAFEARKERKHAISFARINEIQKEMILTGKEGMSWYITGWHRGVEGEMKKLIAYTPIPLGEGGDSRHWSLAVVAPVSEVEGAIGGIQIRQLLLEGASILIILMSGLLIVGILLRWSSTIKAEVEDKTRELAKSEFQCRALIEHAGDIICSYDRNGTILTMNSYGANFFKRKAEDIVGRNVREILPEEVAQNHLAIAATVFERNITEETTFSLWVRSNEYWLSCNFSGLLDENGKVFAVLGIARDITERKKIEQQMAHTEKLASVGTLAAGVAHEINNPLTIVLGFTDMLLEKFNEGSDEYELLKTIERQGLNAKRIVENLLGFARYTEHKEQEVDINKNLESVLDVVANSLAIHKVELRKELAESLPNVKGDAGELQQVFFNLVSNALAAMKDGGSLMVKSRWLEDAERAEVRVIDTGPGIPKAIRSKIFDPFFTTKKVGEGTGLGLSISYGIISKHGGTISFESKSVEESDTPGTTFIITLPAVNKS